MKKKSCIILAAAMVLMMSFSAFAGVWKNDAKGWWYENADGSYLRNGWKTETMTVFPSPIIFKMTVTL